MGTDISVGRGGRGQRRLIVGAMSLWLVLTAGFAAQVAQAKPNPALHGVQTRVAHFQQIEDARLHLPAVPIKVTIASHNLTGTTNGKTFEAAALTDPLDAADQQVGPETHCEMQFSPRIFTGLYSAAEIDGTVAHEVFHCLEGALSGTVARFSAHSSWLVEGAAAWVESALVANDSKAGDDWRDYLEAPGRPLFKRDYDGIGFFGHLSSSGTSPWSVMRAMFISDTNAEAYQASGAGAPSAQKSEASEFFGAPELGDEWTAWHQSDAEANADVPRTHQVPRTVRVSTHPPKPLKVQPMADGIYRLVDDAPRITISVTGGYVRLHSTESPELNEANVQHLTLCRPGARVCQCAHDGGASAKRFTVGDLAVTGGPGGATVTISPSTSCDLPQRSCSSVVSTSDFPPPAQGVFEPTTVMQNTLSESVTGPDAFATSCTYDAPPNPKYGATTPSPLGFADLVVYRSDTEAQAEYAKELAKYPAQRSSVAIGDQAVTTSSSGLMQIDNVVFVFGWYPLSAADESLGADSVLRNVLGSLVP